MRLITKNTDYAVRALLALAGTQEPLSAREISRRQGIPYQFLRRILNRLIAAGLVEAKEGAAGGCRLAVRPDRIRVVDVMRVFQGELRLSECLFRGAFCANRRTCALRRQILRIEGMVRREFAGLTVAGLLKEGKTR